MVREQIVHAKFIIVFNGIILRPKSCNAIKIKAIYPQLITLHKMSVSICIYVLYMINSQNSLQPTNSEMFICMFVGSFFFPFSSCCIIYVHIPFVGSRLYMCGGIENVCMLRKFFHIRTKLESYTMHVHDFIMYKIPVPTFSPALCENCDVCCAITCCCCCCCSMFT